MQNSLQLLHQIKVLILDTTACSSLAESIYSPPLQSQAVSDVHVRNYSVQVLDGDNVFLAKQEQELRTRSIQDWSKYYFTPASLDSGVRALNTWMSKLAQPMPWGPGALPAENPAGQSREQLLDRYHAHTKHCPSCSLVRSP